MSTDDLALVLTGEPGKIMTPLDWCEFHQTGLVIPVNLSLDDWLTLCKRVQLMQISSMWWFGDALAYGVERYGEEYSQVYALAEDLGYKESTLGVAVAVSKRFAPERRNEQVSWSHHLEVVGLKSDDLQDELLQMAIDQKLTTRQLRAHVRVKKIEALAGSSTEEAKTAREAYVEWQDVVTSVERLVTRFPVLEELGIDVLGMVREVAKKLQTKGEH